MKKMLGIMVVGLLLFGFAGQGMAVMNDLDLYRVVYSASKGVEWVSDLGNIGTDIAATSGIITATNDNVGGAFNVSIFNGASDIAVAYFAKVGTAYGVATDKAWVTGGPTSLAHGFTTFASSEGNMGSTYSLTGAGQSVLGTNLYYQFMDSNGTKVGLFGGLLNASDAVNGEMSLASLMAGGSQDLYYYAGTFSGALTGTSAATLSLDANGNTIINEQASSVPVPPSVLLLAPGLLGLIGLRRKSA